MTLVAVPTKVEQLLEDGDNGKLSSSPFLNMPLRLLTFFEVRGREENEREKVVL